MLVCGGSYAGHIEAFSIGNCSQTVRQPFDIRGSFLCARFAWLSSSDGRDGASTSSITATHTHAHMANVVSCPCVRTGRIGRIVVLVWFGAMCTKKQNDIICIIFIFRCLFNVIFCAQFRAMPAWSQLVSMAVSFLYLFCFLAWLAWFSCLESVLSYTVYTSQMGQTARAKERNTREKSRQEFVFLKNYPGVLLLENRRVSLLCWWSNEKDYFQCNVCVCILYICIYMANVYAIKLHFRELRLLCVLLCFSWVFNLKQYRLYNIESNWIR